MVDYFTIAAEFDPIPDKSADTVARAVREYWFMRYGMPEWVTTDNGTEFAGAFRHQLERFGVMSKPLRIIRCPTVQSSASCAQ